MAAWETRFSPPALIPSQWTALNKLRGGGGGPALFTVAGVKGRVFVCLPHMSAHATPLNWCIVGRRVKREFQVTGSITGSSGTPGRPLLSDNC